MLAIRFLAYHKHMGCDTQSRSIPNDSPVHHSLDITQAVCAAFYLANYPHGKAEANPVEMIKLLEY